MKLSDMFMPLCVVFQTFAKETPQLRQRRGGFFCNYC